MLLSETYKHRLKELAGMLSENDDAVIDLIRKNIPYIVFGDHTKAIKFIDFQCNEK